MSLSATMKMPDQDVPPIPEDNDALFAQELNKLSMKERDEVLHDVHGVSDVMDEEPAFVEKCFRELQVELLKIKSKPAYDQALLHNEAYVKDEKFMLMFLRAEGFDPKSAAARTVSFFEAKLQLFGPELLARDVKVSDLDEDDVRCLESGYAQILPGRDRAGRAIFMLLPMIKVFKVHANKLKALYMVTMHALQDVETQRRGMIGLAYNVGRDHTKDREAVWKNAKLLSAIPVRFKCLHYCYDDEKVRTLFQVAMLVFNRSERFRCRFQFGTDMECIYNLMTFGIPSDILPVQTSGELRLEAHQEYVRRMRKQHDSDENIPRIILPSTDDVLLGRGKPLQKHPGNLRYHHIIETYNEQYEKAMKLEKTNISKWLVEQIQDAGGRFLKQDDVAWVEIDDDAARYKVSHTFRNHRIAKRTAEKKAKAAAEVDHRRKHISEYHSDSSVSAMSLSGRAESPLEKRRRLSDFG
mmetsp:Transcript_87484/g.131231  ORF Transcript_87484/g.131231 Transcript_87484/m.131231 type:complete len:468 (+) Transcript_87484:35-1438(+)